MILDYISVIGILIFVKVFLDKKRIWLRKGLVKGKMRIFNIYIDIIIFKWVVFNLLICFCKL